jgi:medium-chain acyl-[acyl-carrier-protein] hydrolase
MIYFKTQPNSKLRLFCFPYAGGGSAFYHRWASSLPKDVQICPVPLPGRE